MPSKAKPRAKKKKAPKLRVIEDRELEKRLTASMARLVTRPPDPAGPRPPETHRIDPVFVLAEPKQSRFWNWLRGLFS